MMLNTRHRLSGSAIAIVAAFCALSGAGCSSTTHKAEAATGYRMGDQVILPPLTYSVVQSTWKTQLGEFPMQRVPERNFLLIRVSVTNSGGSDVAAPIFAIENSAGDKFTELQDGAGVDNWLGLVRTLKPAETSEGWILFDAPTNSYRLRIADVSDVNRERAAYVEIPLRLD